MSYNAGPTRMRTWQNEFANIQQDIVVESIPYKETRWFIYKLLKTSVAYGILYFKKNPDEIINSFYPNIK